MMALNRVCFLVATIGLLASCASMPRGDSSTLPNFDSVLKTEDGWSISLFRWPAHGEAKTPVLLIPSVGLNRLAFTAPGSNLAEFLSTANFDVWIVETRGSVSSEAPTMRDWRKAQSTIGDLLEHDLADTVAHILETTGKDSLFLFGHGFGAHLGVRYAKKNPKQVRGLVALGLGGDLSFSMAIHQRLSRGLGLPTTAGAAPVRSLGKALSPVLHLAPDTNQLHLLFNEANVSVATVAEIAARGLEDVQAGVFHELRDFWTTAASSEQRDFVESLEGGQAPALFVSGRVDPIAPPWAAQSAFHLWGGQSKEWIVLGEAWGEVYDYGHLDLVLGDALREELYPRLKGWLEQQITGESGEASTASLPAPASKESASIP